MARGVISGVIWGGIVSGLVAASVSLINGPVSFPRPEATSLEVPPGSEFDRAGEDRMADLPEGDSAPSPALDAPRAAAPMPDDLSPQAGADTDPGVVPDAAQDDPTMAAPAPQGAADAPAMASDGDAPVGRGDHAAPRPSAPDTAVDEGPTPDVTAALPAEERETDGDAGVEQGAFPSDSDAAAQTPEPLIPPQPEAEQGTTVPGVEAPGAAEGGGQRGTALPDDPEPDAATQPGAQVDSAKPGVGTPATRLTDRDEASRLPTVGDADEAEGAEGTDGAGPPPAITQYAADFEAPEGAPLMSIILIDGGDSPIGLEALSAFPYPLSFAVDASRRDAAEAMARYRAAGFEVIARIGLPEGATPADTEVAMASYLRAMPEVVAVMEKTPGILQSSRPVAEQIGEILAESGHGLILFPKGLDTARKLAGKAGVPAATVFRDFDAEGEGAATIRRFLDRAAFRARQQDEGVVMVGRLRPDTISALLLWGLQDQSGTVAPAPVSALLRAEQAQ
ncbi:MAG: divergent polysaccharide deacetylase family protein [Sediminimonas qiaohouensis]|uniref:Divergent polysaccharide deacetylase family protein n=1 Tax=Sediminimonas qiaohouensis TaxID=552061 RepID=A0A7C9HBL7_9RHOB|nr:polysaccharide deacteylase family 2 protein [Sediminimonas qiaohouensis]MTJ05284.1 divergent polysaccharide deacetylase family protein [Sediminimonas qiaohouensis]